MALASGRTVREQVQACIGHTVSQPNGLGQMEGGSQGRGDGGALLCQRLTSIDLWSSTEHNHRVNTKNQGSSHFSDTYQNYISFIHSCKGFLAQLLNLALSINQIIPIIKDNCHLLNMITLIYLYLWRILIGKSYQIQRGFSVFYV